MAREQLMSLEDEDKALQKEMERIEKITGNPAPSIWWGYAILIIHIMAGVGAIALAALSN